MPRTIPPNARTRALMERYSLEHCAELLDADPRGMERLYRIARETAPRRKVAGGKPLKEGSSLSAGPTSYEPSITLE